MPHIFQGVLAADVYFLKLLSIVTITVAPKRHTQYLSQIKAINVGK